MTDWNWKQEATKRRDERNAKDPVRRKPVPGKKDKKRWCRGKVGVEHKPVCRDYNEAKLTRYINVAGIEIPLHKGWKLLVCTECGKELAHYYPMGAFKRNPPEWVKEAG